jgi:hypothetical protein
MPMSSTITALWGNGCHKSLNTAFTLSDTITERREKQSNSKRVSNSVLITTQWSPKTIQKNGAKPKSLMSRKNLNKITTL